MGRLVRLELVGLGCNSTSSPLSTNFDVSLLSAARALRCLQVSFEQTAERPTPPLVETIAFLTNYLLLAASFQVAGWGDTQLPLDSLLVTLPHLDQLYLEDLKLVLEQGRGSQQHGLGELTIFHCGTRDVDLITRLTSLTPSLKCQTNTLMASRNNTY